MTGTLPINLHDLIRQRTIEGERVEYKAGWNPQSVLHTVCAFANDFHNLGGGYVVLGVEELNGQPVLPPKGIDSGRIDSVQNELLRLGQSAMQPHYHPLTGVYEVEGRTILALWAPGGETRPYKARVSLARGGTDWAYYIRRHSSTVRARGADERELLSLAATVPFDDRYHQEASLTDLSPRLIERFLRDVGSDLALETGLSTEALGRRMNIVGGPSEACFPKNVGLLFLNEAPHRFFPATQIDVVWFPDGPGGDRFEEKELRGPLAVILREAIDFIGRNYLKETVIKHPHQPEAERFWNFPLRGYRGSPSERDLPPLVRGAGAGGGTHHAAGTDDLELSRRRPVDPHGRSADRSRHQPPLPEPPHRRVSEGARLGRGPVYGHSEDPARHAREWVTDPDLRDRRRPHLVPGPSSRT